MATDPSRTPTASAGKVHAYAVSFGDDLAHSLVRQHSRVGQVVLDPFAGSATTLRQAQLLGRQAIGIDVDPVACLIARVVTRSYSSEELTELEQTIFGTVSEMEAGLTAMTSTREDWPTAGSVVVNGFRANIPDSKEIDFWFDPLQRVLLALLVQVARSCANPTHREILQLAISSAIIRKWPNTISQARDIDHSRPH